MKKILTLDMMKKSYYYLYDNHDNRLETKAYRISFDSYHIDLKKLNIELKNHTFDSIMRENRLTIIVIAK